MKLSELILTLHGDIDFTNNARHTKTSTFAAPARFKAAVLADIVVPVVKTSSIKTSRFPVIWEARERRISNAPFTFRRRALAFSPAWVGVSLVLRMASWITGVAAKVDGFRSPTPKTDHTADKNKLGPVLRRHSAVSKAALARDNGPRRP